MQGIQSGLLAFALVATPGVYSASDDNVYNPPNIELYFNGVPDINTGARPGLRLFTTWCTNTCVPTTAFTFIDPVTEKELSKARVWINNISFSIGANTLCFAEFIEHTLQDGIIYTLGRTCGTFMDKTLVPPRNNPDAEVLATGGEGTIVGGTRNYANTRGTFNNRVFIEFYNRSSILFYDGLLFNMVITK